jgi:hypothetical protein
VSKIVFTGELPTLERYNITEVGIWSAGSNPSANFNDSRTIFLFNKDEQWQHNNDNNEPLELFPIETKLDVEFFNKVMRQDAKSVGVFKLGYGDEEIRYVDGWIRDLYTRFSNYKNLLPSDFKEYKCNCEVELINNYSQ